MKVDERIIIFWFRDYKKKDIASNRDFTAKLYNNEVGSDQYHINILTH